MFSLPFLTLALAALVTAAPKPDVDVSIKFPDSNPFGRVFNGGSNNLLHVRLANHAGEEIVVTKVHGQYREAAGRQRALRNTTTLPLQQSVLPGLASPLIPYKFHSENKIGEVGLRVWVDYLDAGKKLHTALGYEGTVTVVEPPTNWSDPELILLYLIFSALFSFAAYTGYHTLFPPPKKSKRAPKPVPAVAKGPEGEKDAKGYDEDWIPAHVLQPKRKGFKGDGATSGEESEGAKKRKGRK